jgi:hypothetical protein
MPKGLSRIEKLEIWERDNFICIYCGEEVTDYNKHGGKLADNAATIDHILPISKGGKSTKDNLGTACNLCNRILGDRFDNYEEKKLFIARVKHFITKNCELIDDNENEVFSSLLTSGKFHHARRKAYWNKRQKMKKIRERKKGI